MEQEVVRPATSDAIKHLLRTAYFGPKDRSHDVPAGSR
jgi:hypothetical protein